MRDDRKAEALQLVQQLTYRENLILNAVLRYINGDAGALDSVPDEYRHMLTR